MIYITETLLYACFAIFIGGLILTLVPEGKKPTIHLPKGWMFGTLILIPTLAFFPVLKVILQFKEQFGFWKTTQFILFQFEIGEAWLVTLFATIFTISVLRFYFVYQSRLFLQLLLVLGLLLIFALGWSSHVGALYFPGGFISHSIHFLAIVVWIGILIIVGWFSTNYDHWGSFLKWFTPIAVICVLAAFISGIVTMKYVVPLGDYINTWVISYGQSLLVKHLFIIPLLLLAFINAILVRNRLKNHPSFDPRGWIKAESILALIIFGITGFMGQQSPPHDIALTLQTEQPSPLFQFFNPGKIGPNIHLELVFNTLSLVALLVMLITLALMVISFYKKIPYYLSIIFAMLSVASGYLTLMLSIH